VGLKRIAPLKTKSASFSFLCLFNLEYYNKEPEMPESIRPQPVDLLGFLNELVFP
jgi:hypothetical protein